MDATTNTTDFTFLDPRQVQRIAVAHIALNAIANIPGMKPAKSLLDRASAPSDEDWRADPAGVTAWWATFGERAYKRYRTRPVYPR